MITLTYFELGVACLSIAMLVVVLVLYISKIYWKRVMHIANLLESKWYRTAMILPEDAEYILAGYYRDNGEFFHFIDKFTREIWDKKEWNAKYDYWMYLPTPPMKEEIKEKGEVGKYNGIRFIDDTKIYRNIFKEGETIDVAPDEILEVTYITRGDKIKKAEIRKKKSKC